MKFENFEHFFSFDQAAVHQVYIGFT